MKNVDFTPIVLRSVACGFIITLAAARLGYEGVFATMRLAPMAAALVIDCIIASIVFFAINFAVKFVQVKNCSRWVQHLVGAGCVVVAASLVLYYFGYYIPQWAQEAFSQPIAPVWQQVAQLSLPAGLIWFVANLIGDSIKGRNKKGE